MKIQNKQFVIGVDGGGTKTVAAIADINGKILRISKSGPSNLRNIGIKEAIKNITQAINNVLKKEKISSVCVALAAIEEEFNFQKERIKTEILNNIKNPKLLKGEIEIVSDQLAAFRTGTNKKEGIVLISGTGCVVHGWENGKEIKVSGWGFLNDEGSGFWIGQKAFQAIFKDLDFRGQKTELTKIIFKEWRLKNKEELMEKIYSWDFVRKTSLISKIVDKAAKKGDKIAKIILIEAGKELTKNVKVVIKKLKLQKKIFPLVLIGKVFNSKIVLETVKKDIKKINPNIKIIRPKKEPVIGAIKIAIEKIKK